MTRASFAVHSTPVGDAVLIVTPAGLAGLAIVADDNELTAHLVATEERLRMRLDRDQDAARDAAAQLDDYFRGDLRAFSLPLDLRTLTPFTVDVLKEIRDIPYAQTASYAEIAARAGKDRAHRAVGTICARTPISIVIPVHRVVRADGSVGEYGRHPEIKRRLVEFERTVAAER